ncbi:hypothetical protein NPIL_109991 [Nephila pilipes]|uniref:Uncharacterized protein n=1 Tax=Nephila pilipes TaxID=299642 RepID=A0A8X6UK90_NEPPI|nr:hypothetical protein NPIL_109991 [Nephila pilipes]
MLGVPPSSIRNFLYGVRNQYPYKLQSCHELLPLDIVEREAFERWALSKTEQDSSQMNKIPLRSLTSCGQTKLIFRSMVTLIPITVASGQSQNHECTQKNHCISPKSQCGVG